MHPLSLHRFENSQIKGFKTRVRNAVAWLNQNQKEAMQNAIRSMPERLEALVEAKGAMTGY